MKKARTRRSTDAQRGAGTLLPRSVRVLMRTTPVERAVVRGGDGGIPARTLGALFTSESPRSAGSDAPPGGTRLHDRDNLKRVLTGESIAAADRHGFEATLSATADPHDRAHQVRTGRGLLVPAADGSGRVRVESAPRKYHASQLVGGVAVKGAPGGRVGAVGVDSSFDETFERERRLAGLSEELDGESPGRESPFVAMRRQAIARFGIDAVRDGRFG